MTALAASSRTAPAARAVRVLVVDDSAVVRAVFERIFEAHDDIDLVGSVADTAAALTFLTHRDVDIVLLDIEMPGRSGLDALPDMLAAAGDAPVLIVSSYGASTAAAAIRALELGACDTLAKPGGGGTPGQFAGTLVARIKSLARAPAARSVAAPATPSATVSALPRLPVAIAIGGSTGGIGALITILQQIDERFEGPIFVTQHLPAVFMPFLAEQLATHTQRDVQLGTAGVQPQPRTIYIAPGDAHLVIAQRAGGIVLDTSTEDVAVRYCPSLDPLLATFGRVYGDRGLGVVLSGMGQDGLIGARALRDAGGVVIAQDPASSVVWGMPGAVVRAGVAHHCAPPERIAAMINQTLGNGT